MIQSQLAAQAAVSLNSTILDSSSDPHHVSSDPHHLAETSWSPPSPPQRKRGRPRLDETEKRPRKSYVCTIVLESIFIVQV